MATTKQITAKFILDSTGFNSSITGVNRELRNAKSELKDASAQVGVFGRDSERLKSVQDALGKQVELSAKKVDIYRKSIDDTTTKMNDNIKQRDRLKTSLDQANKSYDEAVKLYGKESEQAQKAKAEVEKLEKEYKNKEKAVEANAKSVQYYEGELSKANAEMTKTEGELKKVNEELARSENRWVKTSDTLKKHGKSIRETSENIEKVGTGILKATAPMVGLGVASLKAGIDFESAFAGVRKTVDASEEDFKRLEVGIRDMALEIPASASAIAEVGEAAGQLGIETPNILGFTRTMIDLGESTNMSSDQAATSLARLANITGMSQQDFDKLGSTIVALGNNLATTESEIVEMGLRLAGAGKQVGMTEAQIMGFAGALSSVGIEAQAGGSAFSKVMIEMQLAVETNSKKLNDFAKVAGMSASDFKKAFQEDASGAIIAFIQGLGNMDDSGQSAIKVLDDMGIKEVRLRDALLRASGASDVFTDSIELGTNAWHENTALTDEAAQRYETTASKLAILKNQFIEAGLRLADVLLPYLEQGIEKVGQFADWLGDLDAETLETTAKMVGFAVAIGGVLKVGGSAGKSIGTGIELLGTLAGKMGATTLATKGIGTAAATAGGTGGLGALATGLGGVIAGAAPFLLAGGAIAGIGYAVHKGMSEEAVPAVDLFADKVEITADELEANYGRMNEAIEENTIKISESTKEAVGAYLQLDEEATATLNQMYVTQTVLTEENTQSLISLHRNMADTIIAGENEKHNESYAIMQDFFASSIALNEAQEAKILERMKESNSNKNEETQKHLADIEAIYKNASDQKREITSAEQQQINMIQERMKENAIKTLSENEVEAGIILERMKAYDGRITAEQASEHIKQLNKSRDGAIKAAEEEYDGRVAAIIRMRDETGEISANQADKLIKDAQRTKDDTIKAAEDTRNEAVDKIFGMNKDLQKNVDASTGDIISKWQRMFGTWDRWQPKSKTTTVTTRNVTRNEVVNGRPVGTRWTGDDYFQGGLTTLHEKGYEIYNLPRGSRIYNHEASENLVMKTAEAVARRIVNAESGGGKGVSVTQHIHVPTSNPSEIARQTKKQLQTMAFGM